jgi:hypothetical protein
LESDVPLDGHENRVKKNLPNTSPPPWSDHASEIVALKLLPAKTKVKHYDINDLYRYFKRCIV